MAVLQKRPARVVAPVENPPARPMAGAARWTGGEPACWNKAKMPAASPSLGLRGRESVSFPSAAIATTACAEEKPAAPDPWVRQELAIGLRLPSIPSHPTVPCFDFPILFGLSDASIRRRFSR